MLKWQKYHILMIYLYDDKNAKFPSYTTVNAQSHSLQDLCVIGSQWYHGGSKETNVQQT